MTDERSGRRDSPVNAAAGPDVDEASQMEQPEDPATTMAPPEKEGRMVSADMQVLIGRQLRAVYDDIATQPVPNRFVELLMQLESKTA